MDLPYLAKLSPRIGLEWYILGIELGFQTQQLEQLRHAYPHAIPQCVSEMLTKWYRIVIKEISDPSALLFEAFRNIERTDISFEINKDFNVTNIHLNPDKLLKIKKLLTEVTFERTSTNFDLYYRPSKCCIDNFERVNKHVQTGATNAAIQQIKETKYLTVIGNPGDGKTTVAMHSLSHISHEGYFPIILSDPGLIEQVYDPDKKIVYFVDDAFGTPTLNKNLVETWIRLHGKLKALIVSGNCHIILASRKQTYLRAFTILQDYSCYVENVIDLTSPQFQLTPIEKINIITCYFPDQNVMFPKRHILPPIAYMPGFPLICKLYSKQDKRQNPSEFFEKPISFLQKQFSILAESDLEAYCALVLVMLYDGKLPSNIFDPFEMEEKDKKKITTIAQACGINSPDSLTGIEKSLKSLIGVYLLENQDDHYNFMHDAIFDAICLEFGQKYPKQVLDVATSEFIASRVRIEKTSMTDITDVPEVIIIKPCHYNCLVLRWMRDIKNGNFRYVFDNPCSQNVGILKCIVEKISELPDEQFKKMFVIEDHVLSTTLLELICRRGLTAVLEQLIKCPAFKSCIRMDILALSFFEAIKHRNDEIVAILLKLEPKIHRASCKNAPIHVASENGDVKILKMLINAGADVSSKDIYLIQPVHLVSKCNSSDCLSLLIKNGALCSVTDHSGFEPIHYACKNGSLDCLKILIDNGANVNNVNMYKRTPLHYAAFCENTDILKYLLGKGPDIKALDENGNSALHFAVKSKRADNIELLFKAGSEPNHKNALGNTPLHILCLNTWKDADEGYRCLKVLLKNGANPNIPDAKLRTSLHLSCSWSHDLRYNFVKLLIDKGAEISVFDDEGVQPLLYAFRSKSTKCSKLMIEKGGNTSISDLYPIHFACANGSMAILSALYDKGFDLNSKDSNEKYPIHFASQYGHEHCLQFLLEKGADPNIKDGHGQTPLHYTCKWGKTKCSEILISRGADESAKDEENKRPSDLIPPSSPSRIFTKNVHTTKNQSE